MATIKAQNDCHSLVHNLVLFCFIIASLKSSALSQYRLKNKAIRSTEQKWRGLCEKAKNPRQQINKTSLFWLTFIVRPLDGRRWRCQVKLSLFTHVSRFKIKQSQVLRLSCKPTPGLAINLGQRNGVTILFRVCTKSLKMATQSTVRWIVCQFGVKRENVCLHAKMNHFTSDFSDSVTNHGTLKWVNSISLNFE